MNTQDSQSEFIDFRSVLKQGAKDIGKLVPGMENILPKVFESKSFNDVLDKTDGFLSMGTAWAKSFGVEKEKERHCCFFVMTETDVFDLETFKEKKEMERLEKWFENIGQTVCFEDTNLLLNEDELEEVHKKIGYEIPIDKKDNVINDIGVIKGYFLAKKQMNNVTKNYTNRKTKYVKSNQCDETSQQTKIQILKNPYIDFDRIAQEQESINSVKKRGNAQGYNDFLTSYSGYSADNYENNSLRNLGGLHTPPKKNFVKYCVVYNQKYKASFSIKNPDELDIMLLQDEKMGFKLSYDISVDDKNTEFLTVLNTLLCGRVHDSEKEFQKRISTIKTLYEQSECDMKDKTEYEYVESFLKDRYKINDRIDDKIKASEILKIVEEHLETNMSGFVRGKLSFRNKLSKYLLDLGLKKKRFGDGFYYYGLKLKNGSVHEKYGNINQQNILEKIINDRQKELNKD